MEVSNLNIGIVFTNVVRLLNFFKGDDIIMLIVQRYTSSLALMFETPHCEADFKLKLVDLKSEPLVFPEVS